MEAVLISSNEVELDGSQTSLNNPHTGRKTGVLQDVGFVKNRAGPESLPQDARITINVCGRRFEVPVPTLVKCPNTLLGDPVKMSRFYDATRDEYFFNRNQDGFKAILNYYQTGILRRPVNFPLDAFVAEARFYEIGQDALLEFCENEGFRPKPPKPLPSNPICRKIWKLVEMPESSLPAKIFAITGILVIIISVFVFCIETLPKFQRSLEDANSSSIFNNPFFIIESICIGWFTAEFLLRFFTCPSNRQFIKSPLNIIDIIAIVPYYVDLGITLSGLASGTIDRTFAGSLVALRVLRIFRVFRIFKLSRHSKGLQILGQTFAMSLQEMGLLLLFLGIGVILFSSGEYYAELGVEKTHFTSIPEGFWWAVVTMTTVGYGDMAPQGVFGKLIGAVCAVSGLIAIALPVPVIVSNFNTIYQREKERSYVEEILRDTLLTCKTDDSPCSDISQLSGLDTDHGGLSNKVKDFSEQQTLLSVKT